MCGYIMSHTIGLLVNVVTKIHTGCLIELFSHFYLLISLCALMYTQATDWSRYTQQTSKQKLFIEEEHNILLLKAEERLVFIYFIFSLLGFLEFVAEIHQIIV